MLTIIINKELIMCGYILLVIISLPFNMVLPGITIIVLFLILTHAIMAKKK